MTTLNTPCTRWEGTHRQSDGRPLLGRAYAYRALWEQAHGPLAPDLILHHGCDNSWCVNLEHLEPMTQGEHLRRHGLPGDWGQALKTHCPEGHAYTEENTYVHVTATGPERHCRTCRRAARRRHSDRQKARRAT